MNGLPSGRVQSITLCRCLFYRVTGHLAVTKATIEFEDLLYRRLKVEAARRGRTVRDLVAEGLRHVLDAPALPSAAEDTAAAWCPLGSRRWASMQPLSTTAP